ncbi:putative hexulose-6-phosphate isomerase [Treponema socranskii subsp. socranskii VPI DR56BR1116 = ATCC 35536]|uniref:L-ribulose-5-phosphate 3-epimerase n=1 Tax=Treponema socranskii subsp. socranskii VPI DR56BR1116 = ATCC 35536 TaxID=1125725 RepID=U1FLV2_TRESO|nr:L-ribulose-5-phosphate 3-epimerase [Treponema socranskii]ERF60406.1 putative hexulose-6-phosphate isomerase [Treponema socranskii subsp. socranskii VPI DR56BR1116 = ATCC 35536]ERJ97679.1 putative hexulose-6-phosphate isomerase [Treponema socranskii subsp. socranskii VPI DR56BR1116 = ATCC 35536]
MDRMYKIGLYEKAMPKDIGWKEKIQVAKSAGYDYIEISIDETDEKLARLDWSDAQIRDVVSVAYGESMGFGSICLSGQRRYALGDKDETKSLEILEKAIRFARIAGIPVIQMAGYDTYYAQSTEETEKRFRKNLALGTAVAAKEGIILAFETMETPFMDTMEKAMRRILPIASPYLGVYPDIGNLNNAALLYKSDILADMEKGKGHIVAAHIKETMPGKYREVPFGTGVVDFERILKKLWQLGVRRYVTELWYTGNDDWKQAVNGASSFARKILDGFAGM